MDLSKLKERMPFKWRVQQQTEYNATCVAYVDSRQVQDKLDEVVGPENWQSDFKVVNNNMYAAVIIKCDNEWVYKWDCGTESNTEKEKGEASDAFKRAAVKWGVGRFLYDMPLQKIKVKKHTNAKIYPCNDNGDILWDSDSLTDFINTKIGAGTNPSMGSPPAQVSTRYEKPAEEPSYTAPNKPKWSKATQEKASRLERDGLKGSQVLVKYLPQYNEKMNTSFKVIPELDTDAKLESLIKYVEDLPPAGMI